MGPGDVYCHPPPQPITNRQPTNPPWCRLPGLNRNTFDTYSHRANTWCCGGDRRPEHPPDGVRSLGYSWPPRIRRGGCRSRTRSIGPKPMAAKTRPGPDTSCGFLPGRDPRPGKPLASLTLAGIPPIYYRHLPAPRRPVWSRYC